MNESTHQDGCSGTMVLCQQIIENQAFRDDETADEMVLRARMVFLGGVQALGTIFGLGITWLC